MSKGTTHQRPNTAVTAKVVAAHKGWKKASWQTPARSTDMMLFYNSDLTAERIPVTDPRDDTNAALRLLGCLVADHRFEIQSDWETFGSKREGWVVLRELPYDQGIEHRVWMPFSGPEFCYAVIALTARVLGVEGEA